MVVVVTHVLVIVVTVVLPVVVIIVLSILVTVVLSVLVVIVVTVLIRMRRTLRVAVVSHRIRMRIAIHLAKLVLGGILRRTHRSIPHRIRPVFHSTQLMRTVHRIRLRVRMVLIHRLMVGSISHRVRTVVV